MTYADNDLREVLTEAKVIALVGFSANPARPSHGVAQFLVQKGYRVIPVNPGLAGQVFEGEKIYASLAEIPDEVDMVDVFRASEAVPEIVEESLRRWPGLKYIWLQIGVIHDEALARAEARGVRTVQNLCPKIEIPRLGL